MADLQVKSRTGGGTRMTPLYDVISLWPYIGDGADRLRWRSAGLAMAVRATNAHYALHTIQARHWHALAMKNGRPAVWEAMCAMVEQVASALDRVEARLPEAFPRRIWRATERGIRAQARKFVDGLAATKSS